MLNYCIEAGLLTKIASYFQSENFGVWSIIAFAILGLDRIITVLNAKHAQEKFSEAIDKDDSNNNELKQVKRFGVTNEILSNTKRMANLALALLLLKPIFLLLSFVDLEIIDFLFVLTFSGAIVYQYRASVSLFKKRKQDGHAAKTPLAVQRAFLDASLAEMGANRIQIYVLLGITIFHSASMLCSQIFLML
ncbi:MAG: hypothetical protein EP347_08190 [Alphaproteobacteria bacterium]|nr:MAG: hypothetical protein EP347_08190 [Alphaproteobacteria bacterium]